MSAAPTTAATDVVNIEIDGVALTAPKGSMIIHASDKAGISIPRFCYHEKLPIAANCRMCLVDVEKMPKPAIDTSWPCFNEPTIESMIFSTARSASAFELPSTSCTFPTMSALFI